MYEDLYRMAKAALAAACDEDRGIAEISAISSIVALVSRLRTARTKGHDDAWIADRFRAHQLEFFGGAFEEIENEHPLTDRLVEVFSDRYSQWVADTYNRDPVSYVPNLWDREALAKDVVPYLRARSNGRAKAALMVWQAIVDNFFANPQERWLDRPPSIRDTAPILRQLELGPLGASSATLDRLEGPVADVVHKFLEHCPTGRWSKADAVQILEYAESPEDALAAIDWMYAADCKDEYLRTNRPFTLGFIARAWDRWERNRPKKVNPAKQAAAKASLRKQLEAIR